MIVVDCSAVVDALSGVTGADDLRAVLAGDELHAPALIDYEVVAAVRGLTLGGHLGPERAQALLSDLADLPIHRWSADHELLLRAFDLRESVSAYDAAYVVLAEGLGCSLVTRDGRLGRSTGHDVEITVL